MKTFSRFPVSALALAAVFVCGVGLIHAQDDAQARRDEADKLLAAMHTEQMVEGTTTRMLSLVDRFNQSAVKQGNLSTEQSDAIQKAEDEARTTIRTQLGYPALKADFVNAYADAFSIQELKDLTTFYGSPIGQKLVEKQPGLNEKLGQLAQQKVRTVMPGVVQKLREVAQKNAPPAPAPAAAAPAPAAPGTTPPLVVPIVPSVPAAPVVPPAAAATPASATTAPVSAPPEPIPSPTAAATPTAQ